MYSSNKCWIFGGLFAERDNEIRHHDHVTGKYRGSAHWDFNFNLKLTKKIPVIFHKLRGYDSHSIVQENISVKKIICMLLMFGMHLNGQWAIVKHSFRGRRFVIG